MKEKLNKYREMTKAEIENEILKRKEELFNLRFQHITGQLENPMRIREVRREIAKIKTIEKEKEKAGTKIVEGKE